MDGALLVAMEGYAHMAIDGKDWMMKLNEELLDNLGKYRKYNRGTPRGPVLLTDCRTECVLMMGFCSAPPHGPIAALQCWPVCLPDHLLLHAPDIGRPARLHTGQNVVKSAAPASGSHLSLSPPPPPPSPCLSLPLARSL